MLRGYIRGRAVWWDSAVRAWRWADTGDLAEGWGGPCRSCLQCGRMPVDGGPDPCIGHIDGATGACCGHGVSAGYVSWPGAPPPLGWKRGAYVGAAEDMET